MIHAIGITMRVPITLRIESSITPSANNDPVNLKDFLPVLTARRPKASLKQRAPSKGSVRDATIAKISEIILKSGERPAIEKQRVIAIVRTPMKKDNL